MFALNISQPAKLIDLFSVHSPLNPHFFAYGSLPIYLLRLTSSLAGHFDPAFLTYEKMGLVGRFLSSIFDTITILLVFLVANKLLNKHFGYLSAFLYAIAVFPIQNTHFYTVDTLLTFFLFLSAYKLLRWYEDPSKRNIFHVGITFGFAVATKISALPFVAVIALSFLIILLRKKSKKNFLHLIVCGAIFLVSLFVINLLVQPYAFIDWHEFLNQTQQQSQMTHSPYAFPYTLQYVGKIHYWYELKNIALWGLGPVMFSFVLIGVYFLAHQIRKHTKRNELLIFFIFPLIFLAIIGSFAVGFMRYLLPIYPYLAILAGFGIWFSINLVKQHFKFLSLRLLGLFFLGLLIIIWPISFLKIYQRENTRFSSTDWILKNIPSGSTLAIEHWDDRIPVTGQEQYQFNELTLYDQPDDSVKWNKLHALLQNSDYIIIASNRLYVPLQKLTDCNKFQSCYPRTSQYYHQLFNGQLGYKKIVEFTDYPTIPFTNIQINDTNADESFTVFDHPKVLIFKKTGYE
jgi:hypothetical protein